MNKVLSSFKQIMKLWIKVFFVGTEYSGDLLDLW